MRVLGAAGDGEVAHVVLVPDPASAGDGPFEGTIRLLDGSGEVLAECVGASCEDDGGVRDDVPHAPRERQRVPRAEADAPGDGLTAFVVAELRTLASGILKYEPAELDAHTGFDAFGFDSISFVTFARLIGERFGAEVTPAAFFDVNTFDALARHLVAEYAEPVRAAYERSGSAPAAATVTPEPTASYGPHRLPPPRRPRTPRSPSPSSAPRAASPARPTSTPTGPTSSRAGTRSPPSHWTATTPPTGVSPRPPTSPGTPGSWTTWTPSTRSSSASTRARRS